ncbi:uncharacterized protein [Dermacentor albipictus]|uniref:uncharacterized protein n=1 Tax=Dermacentor albipictus TaxID=60249 RepID=UPI0031FD3A92
MKMRKATRPENASSSPVKKNVEPRVVLVSVGRYFSTAEASEKTFRYGPEAVTQEVKGVPNAPKTLGRQEQANGAVAAPLWAPQKRSGVQASPACASTPLPGKMSGRRPIPASSPAEFPVHPPVKNSRLRNLTVAAVALAIIFATASLVTLALWPRSAKSSPTSCDTPGCQAFANAYAKSIRRDVPPCTEFAEFVCAGLAGENVESVRREAYEAFRNDLVLPAHNASPLSYLVLSRATLYSFKELMR